MSAPCRSCGAPLAAVFVDLGLSPISNAFPAIGTDPKSDEKYPLRCFVCDVCKLVQLDAIPSREMHFHDGYAYFSSYADSWLDHARAFAELAIERFSLNARSSVVEVASNDGYLLQYFLKRGIPSLGVDPAANCAKAAKSRHGLETRVAFFGRETAEELAREGRRADLIIANNVLAHVSDINDFVAGFPLLLKPEGYCTFEFPHVLELIANSQFDTIYHEHYSYLSYLALAPLFARHGLAAVDAERLPTHGGSLRLYVRHARVAAGPSEALKRLIQDEQDAALDRMETYSRFSERVGAARQNLLTLLNGIRNEGKSIAGYGAPAKAATLLNYCGIGSDTLAFTVDRNPLKQGKRVPGTDIPVRAPETIPEAKPDFVMILPWNLREEIVKECAEIQEWGGKFIVPIPAARILD